MKSEKFLELVERKRLCKCGFTLLEIIIASGVLAIFMVGLFSLFGGGSRLTNSTIWVQNITNQLRMACREINQTIKKSSYPSSFEFPGKITVVENEECFYLKYVEGPTNAEGVTSGGGLVPGKVILSLTESTPAKSGFGNAVEDAVLIYHIFSLDTDGKFRYSRFSEDVAFDAVAGLSRTGTPPSGATAVFMSVLAHDVYSIECKPTNPDPNSLQSPLSIKIICRDSRGSTERSAKTVGNPNVKLLRIT